MNTPKVDKWSQFIAQLIERTQDNRVQWSTYTPKPVDGATIQVEIVYQSKYQDKALRLFETRLKKGLPDIAWLTDPRVREEIVLKIVDEQQNDLFRFPDTSALRDLLTAVKYQVAKIDDFLQGILEQ